jgi:hypothetical protein
MIKIIKIVTCDRCKKKIPEGEPIWYINQQGEYGSKLDGDIISKQLCDDCMEDILNEDSG